MRPILAHLIVATCIATGAMNGCVQLPTEKQGAVDMRPRIGFDVHDTAMAAQARVIVDGLDAGPLNGFMNGVGTLRLLNGNHLVQVVLGSRAVLEQRIFLADGAQRQLQVNLNGSQ